MSAPQPAAVGNLLTDSAAGRPTTRDATSTVAFEDILRVYPDANKSPLPESLAFGYSVVAGNIDDEQTGNQANALVPTGKALEPGKVVVYRFISLTPGSFMCGASAADIFKSSWGMRGIYLNGSNGALVGRGLLRSGYSLPFAVPGSCIDWFMSLSNDGRYVDVTISLDGKMLGPAFHLDMTGVESLIPKLRPAVSFFEASDTKVAIIQFDMTTSAVKNDREVSVDPKNPRGTWILNYSDFGGSPNDGSGTLHISDGRISARIANTAGVGAELKPDGTVTVRGPPVSTMMLPPPNLRPIESAFQAFLKEMIAWRLDQASATLYITSQPTGEVAFAPETNVECVTDNPFVN